ncbi:MAG TPA: CARDB domain-containing protein [Baekduia sp.]|nr:CARDB domain-containing protein [Baekduia sp.]
MLLIVALAAAALAGPPAASASAGDKVRTLSAKTVACTTGADDLSRAAAFTGAMPAAAQTKRMMMRFSLQQRLGPGPGGTFKKLAVPGWGDWEKSDPGRQGFVFTKRVEALAAPAAYRAAITFRWLDAKGHVQRTTTRTTPACEQPDPRPDLVLGGVAVALLSKTTAAYTVSVGNEGHADAEPFAVTVTVDGVTSDPLTLGPLAAGDRATGTLTAPRCAPGSTITVTVDVAEAVDESVEDDDAVQRPCPLT